MVFEVVGFQPSDDDWDSGCRGGTALVILFDGDNLARVQWQGGHLGW
jgi:hypothetical protein